MSRFVIASKDAAFRDRVSQAFDHQLNGQLHVAAEGAFRRGPDEVVQAIAGPPGAQTEVVVLGPDMPEIAALELANLFDRQRPDISVVLVATPGPRLWEHALRAGIREVVAPEASLKDLRAAIERASEAAERRREVATASPVKTGRVVTVVSPKGGSGKTTLSVNLAVAMASQLPGRVVLVDLDVQFGDVANALRILPEQTLADITTLDHIDAMAAKVLLVTHESGLYVLCAPDDPATGEQIKAEHCAELVTVLSTEFDWVIVDTSAGLSEQTLAAAEVSTDILLVCTMDVSSVRSLRKEVQALDQLGMTHQARRFVLNRADSRVGLEMTDIERTVGLPVDVQMPSSRAVPLSMNQGIPVVSTDARSPVTKSIQQLLDGFGVGSPMDAPRTGRFGFGKRSN